MPFDLWFEEDSGADVYYQRSANLSAGGFYLENAVPQPVGTKKKLRFQLPDDKAQLRAIAEVVKVDGSGMHLKFVEMSNEVEERIRAFVEQQRRG